MKALRFAIIPLLVTGLGWGFALADDDKSKTKTKDKKTEKKETSDAKEEEEEVVKFEKIEKTEEEWKKQLTEMQFYVTRKQGTERRHTGDTWDNTAAGTYACVCCELPLFTSEAKYKSGTGWPSFYDAAKKGHIATKEDRKLFSVRTEMVCARCDAHIGHVFEDGPEPTGLRYCANSAALKFTAKGAKESSKKDSSKNTDPKKKTDEKSKPKAKAK